MQTRITQYLSLPISATAIALVLASCTGCQPPAENLEELAVKQRQILAKLDRIEKKIDASARARPAAAEQRRGPDPSRAHTLPLDGSDIIGAPDAPISIVEFSDYQCPYCARIHPTILKVLELYPGVVNLVYKHLPLSFHKNAMPAAMAAIAAGNQGRFAEMHDRLFRSTKKLSADDIEAYAREIGVDMARFRADLESPETKAQIARDMSLAQQIGVGGTPTLFVAGRLLNDRSIEGFRQIIESVLDRERKAS